MELKIEIDMNQIDYNKINEAILSKIDEDFIRNLIVARYSTDNQIEKSVKEILTEEIGKYLFETDWIGKSDVVSKANTIANSYFKEIVEELIQKIIDDIGPDDMNRLIVDILPKVLWDYIFTVIHNKDKDIYNWTISDARNSIFNILRSRGYHNI